MKIFKARKIRMLILAACCASLCASHAGSPLIQLKGSDFEGGGKGQLGVNFYGRAGVNMVYAQSNGVASRMTASVNLSNLSNVSLYLLVEGMDDDLPALCHIRVALNGRDLINGRSGFPNGQWRIRRLPIPLGVLKPGTNEIVVENLESNGSLGLPPWFMVTRVAIGDIGYEMTPWEPPVYHVVLPEKSRPFPEPLAPGQQPGFKFRGTKGWAWTPEQYLAEIPYLARFKMNFLMNCYLSLFTSQPPGAWVNEWWKPLPETKKVAYAQVIKACQAQGIAFCFTMNPQLSSPRPIEETNVTDIDALYQHYAWAQSQGVKWFCICLDDVRWGGRAANHACLVNTIFRRLRQADPEAQMIFCPGPYSGDGTDLAQHEYLGTLASTLDKDVYVFWTGEGVIDKRITCKAARSYKSAVQHRIFLWDNYPVNDGRPTMNLGPLSGRDANLCDIVEGYVSNPMEPQNEINRIPLATCADYCFNPRYYDPTRSVGQAILLLGDTPSQREVLKELVENYPGFIAVDGENPVREKFSALGSESRGNAAQQYLSEIQHLATQLQEEFPEEFKDAKNTINADLAWMKAQR